MTEMQFQPGSTRGPRPALGTRPSPAPRAAPSGSRDRDRAELTGSWATGPPSFGDDPRSPATDQLARFALAAIDGVFLACQADRGVTLGQLLSQPVRSPGKPR
jgi:hypothetical protein